MAELIRFGVSLPAELINDFDKTIRRKGYRSRSEAIRDLMRDHLIEDEWKTENAQVMGTISIVYDHETRGLTDTLNALQHSSHHSIVCTTHVHMDAHNCLEVVVVRGSAREVREIADRLISTRGIKHGKLVCTTTGEHL